MMRSTCLAAVALVLAGAGAASAADPADGARIYAEQKCAMCHAVEGKGNAKGPLDGVGSRMTADEIRRWLTEPKEMATKHDARRKPAMKSFAALPKEDLDALVAYLRALKAPK